MALNAYLTLTGETLGEIEGSSDVAPHEGKIEVFDIKHGVLAPFDPATGLSSGSVQHKPLTITKAVDRATPALQSLLYDDETITAWRLELYRPSRTGAETHYYTIELLNARVTAIQLDMPNNRFEDALQLPVMERVSFAYGRIITTFEDAGITAEDDWESRNA
ncbi:MAG: type VI secretion system tube protein TssD [Myxococcales bacterium]|jgi:type VI secretion system secreted protein Hcp